jgi:hypothetical protein
MSAFLAGVAGAVFVLGTLPILLLGVRALHHRRWRAGLRPPALRHQPPLHALSCLVVSMALLVLAISAWTVRFWLV